MRETVSKTEKGQAVKKKLRQMLHAVRKGYSDYMRKRTKGHELPLMSGSSKSDKFQPLKQAEYCSGGSKAPTADSWNCCLQ